TFHQPEIEIIHTLSEQVRHTYAMVDNLLEWFRGQKEGLILHPESLSVPEVVEEAGRLLALNMLDKQLILRVDVDDTIQVNADRAALILVVRNLLSNAVKFSNPGGVIVVSAKSSGGKAEISVQDNGIGMSEEQLRQLFDETRFDSTPGTSGERGTGLGLLVSRQFLRMSGGRLDVHSEPGRGSKFT
ncbi:sensor histidine kinase, partial [Mycobacterium tuberculosis]